MRITKSVPKVAGPDNLIFRYRKGDSQVSDEKTLWERMRDPLPAAVWAVAGAIVVHLWRRYRERMVTLRWQVSHQPLGFSSQDVLFGTIEIRYNGNPVHNLFFTLIEIQNDSNSDLTNVDLNFVFNDGSEIRMSHGAVQGSANMLPFAEPFETDLRRFLTLQQDDPPKAGLPGTLFRRRDYRVPTLNRGAVVRVGMLVQAQTGQQPFIQVASDHPGLRLVFQAPRSLVLGVNHNLAISIGILAGIAIISGLSVIPIGRAWVIAAAFAIGCFSALLGAGLVRTLRWLRRVFG